ncbi:MAG: symmetrical bis(5'-nucleosyl)-tetraphosphatase [Pseudomonadota bacterium]
MAIYVIGDLQGCLDPLKRLLDLVDFAPETDRLWFVGDVVNRGPQSLQTLRFVHELDACSVTVLGNHDLHLLAVAMTGRKSKGKDTLEDILRAEDSDELLDWLRKRPLLHYAAEQDAILVHAGIPPHWDIAQCLTHAREVEQALGGDNAKELLGMMYNDQPELWSDDLSDSERLIYTINAFTRMRYLTRDGRMEFKNKSAPQNAASGLIPWYQAARAPLGARVFFGHWSTLGTIRLGDHPVEAYAMDSGCLWGGHLSAMRADLAELPLYSVACTQWVKPG